MKQIISVSIIAIVSLLLSVSCSKDEIPPNTTAAENTWRLDSYNYARRISSQNSTTFSNGDAFSVISVDSNIANTNTPFVNCNLMIVFNTSTSGEYVIKSQNTASANTKLKNMWIKCIITSGLGTGASYESTDGSITATITQESGKFVINIPSGVTLARTLNDGLPQAPASFTLTANKIR